MSTSPEKLAEALRVSLKEAERLRRRNRLLREASTEPIAIVGMACRYPAGVSTPDDLWRLVAAGVDGISEFPIDRGWDIDRIYDPDPGHPGTSYTREGGFVDDVAGFDPGFFGISPREAVYADPQQRMLLEVCWEALEDAGLDPASLRGSQTGVFAGSMYQDYGEIAGMTSSIVTGRVSYTLGLEGPAVTVDTACSSSLIAMHLAAQALRGGECTLALAGGVTVLSRPDVFVEFSRQRGLSPDGRCKSFAEAADGTGWAEGSGVLVLERLSEAQRNGHSIHAVIRGSAVNQDGASNGLTAPNGPAQERVIRQALAAADLTPQDVDAVEAHGTGTVLGDPIEAGAIIATYGQDREKPLKLGSLKSNIGHTQAAAGVGGVIKMALAMREGALPRTLHLGEPSTKIDWEAGAVELLKEMEPWEAGDRPRRAAVSSFGATGTNAHLILEEPPAAQGQGEGQGGGKAATEDGSTTPLPGPTPLTLSAKTEPALQEAAARLAAQLRADPQLEPLDVAYSLATTRSAFEHRAVALGEDREQLLAVLTSLSEGADHPALLKGRAKAEQRPVFLFAGQGAQHAQMALGLLDSSPSFARHIEQCEQALSPHVEWSLGEVLREEQGSWLDRLDVVQPALFAVMVSLAGLWRQLGVQPAAVLGHSQGEIAAAHVCGALSLQDAARVIALRAKAMTKLAGLGGMLSVSLPVTEAKELLEPYGDRVSLAAINGPASQVLSGEPEALGEILAACERDGVRAQRIAVDYAAHSAQIDQLREELGEAFAPIEPQSATIPFHSTVTGEPIDTEELGAEYWYRNLRQTVLFEPVLGSLLAQGRRAFIEVGPHPVLSFGAEETIEAAPEAEGASVIGTLRRDQGGPERFALSLAQAHAAGVKVDWEAFFKGTGAKRVALPTYPFQRKRYWLGPSDGPGDLAAAGQSSADHPLLGAALSLASGEEWLLTGRLSLQTHPWLADHAVAGTVLFPGTGFVELALRAGSLVGCETLEELTLQAPLVLAGEGATQVQLSVAAPDQRGCREVAIYSRPEAGKGDLGGAPEWTCHAQGILSPEPIEVGGGAPESWPPAGAEPIETDGLYQRLAEVGFEYGPAFQGVVSAWQGGDAVFAELALPEEQAREAQRYGIHPALLDSAAHAVVDLALAASRQEGAEAGAPVVPFAWRGVRVASKGASVLRARIDMDGGGLAFFDDSGEPLASVGSLEVRSIDPGQLRAASRQRSLYRLQWSEAGSPAGPPPSLAILGDAGIDGIEAESYPDLASLLAAVAEGDAPAVVLADFRQGEEGGDLPALAGANTAAALELLKSWIGHERLEGTRLALLTEGAIAAGEDEDPDLATAPLCGLLRAASSEHPGRFCLLDTDGSRASLQALPAALAVEAEPELALREGAALAPRLTRVRADADEPVCDPVDPGSTVLITGGTSGLGALVARHLAAEHGARNLLLVSRRGADAPGAADLAAEIEGLGAAVRIASCDVSDRDQLAALIDSIPAEHPLGAVVHSAAVLDDGVLASLDAERLQRVFAPKADAAWHLHELTKDIELSRFVVFSSVGGLLGNAGQANYAAANAFLDALAQHRHAQGLPATALAWGGWADGSEIVGELSEADQARLGRMGFAPMSSPQVLELLDATASLPQPLLAPVAFDAPGLEAQAKAGVLPAMLRGLVHAPAPSVSGASLAAGLASIPEADREAFALELVRTQVATVLGHASASAIEPDRAFQELGFDSLGAVELRNRLSTATGLRLPPTLVFDYPSAAALAAFLRDEAEGQEQSVAIVRTAVSAEEPIAIIGMSCRYPGGIGSPAELWELVAEGRDGVEEFPPDRGWDLERLYDPEPGVAGASYTRQGGFVEEVAGFDSGFFGISPREAVATDPQQRLLLEACWETLEDAGVDPGALRGSPTGVFAGVMYQDYGNADYGLSPGMTSSLVSGRIAYSLGLQGPAITIDTACSSSLVAMHLAAQALRQGECELALAGGVTVLSTPSAFVFFSHQRGLAADGRSKSFAEAADGTGISEGVGVLALERLSDAERNGHPVLAVIKGSAVNQDGASNGITAPNGPSQERVIRQALANAGLAPRDVDLVEAHGTGTTLGDPIEAGALLATYGQDREAPLKLGSIKSNIGHAQAAAGVGGVIKAVMAMREGVLPKTLHVDAPSSKVDWEAGKVELLREAEPWRPDGNPRRAGVSSFGISGTNAHVILEQAPASSAGEEEAPASPSAEGGKAPESSERSQGEAPEQGPLRPRFLPGPTPLAISAKSEPALRAQAERLAAHLEANPELGLTDVAYSLATTRSAFEHRAVALGDNREQLLGALQSIAKEEPSADAIKARATEGKLAYLFTGQGSQRAGMGKELYEANPAFKEALDRVLEELDPNLDRPLKELLFSEPGSPEAELLDHTTYAQPALFALQVALYEALGSQGLTPDLLTGHSIGEISAAQLAGVLSLSDAAKLVAARGRLMGELPQGGAMVAIEATEAEAKEAIAGKEAELSIAAINAPRAIVLSGQEQALKDLAARFSEQGRKTKELSVSHAFHSALMEPMLEDFAEVAKSLTYNQPQIPLVSNTTGEILSPEQATDPAYWVAHVRQAVRFADAVATLQAQGASAYLELGPDAVLTAMASSCLEQSEKPAALIPSLREGRPEPRALAGALAEAHASGAKLDWEAFFVGAGARRVALPTYAFQRQRYWLGPSSGAVDASAIGQSDPEHPLLGASIEEAEGGGFTLTGRISLATHAWLADHAVAGAVLLPGAAFLELALQASRIAGAERVAELTVEAPLVIPGDGAVQLQISVGGPGEGGERQIAIHSRPQPGAGEEAEGWTRHAGGTLDQEGAPAPEPIEAWPPAGAEALGAELLYARIAAAGVDYGPAFASLGEAWQRGEEIFVEVGLEEAQAHEAARFGLHPALLDPAVLFACLGGSDGQPAQLGEWRGARLHAAAGSSLRLHLSPAGEAWSIAVFDGSGAAVAAVDEVLSRPVDASQLRAAGLQRLLYGLQWSQLDPPGASSPSLAILGDAGIDGIEAEPYPDLASLLAAVAEGDAPEVVLADFRRSEDGGDLPALAGANTAAALELLKAWIGHERLEGTRLALLTEGAIAAGEDEDPDLATAPLCGLLRSAHSEHPGRFCLLDTDGSRASLQALPAALSIEAEPELALREGVALAPRLTQLGADAAEPPGRPIDPGSTVLITGGTSGLGALVARHLATEHGARNLLLVSRRGPEAPAAAELVAELEELGASPRIVACDVSDRDQLAALIDSIPAEHPLGAVVHSAAVLDDGVLASLDAERLQRVFAPKADAAWHLHELTKGLELSQFLVFSSTAGLLGGAAQASYAAANAFLDALAQHRHAHGLPATSLAWGLWGQRSDLGALASQLGEAELARIAQQIRLRLGFAPIPAEQGLELFDAVRARGRPLLAPVAFDSAALRAQAEAGTLPAVLRKLVRAPLARGAEASLATRLAQLPEAERGDFVLEFVRGHVATVLGHSSPREVEADKAFQELGFDSLGAVELRNRLSTATGLRLPPTLVFDYPSVEAVARYLLAEATGAGAARRQVVRAQASEEPIAIVGMACRYPGGVDSPAELWDLVAAGADAVSGFPADRGWDLEGLYHPDPEHPGTCYARGGGFLDDAADFDPGFFGISPREALGMDPQQRLLLEASWQALEDAGVDPASLRGSQTGVFAGASSTDYGLGALQELGENASTGMLPSAISGRVAYTFGLEGPALTVDTACSSSLVAMHLAAQALRQGECSLALAGGVVVLSTPIPLLAFSRQRGLAADGRCKSFAEAADGTSFAEGVGVLALERLSDAERNGHTVLATIRGSAVNQDGASNGLTAPNGPSQERVIRQALANARLEPRDVDVVEAHGTGTVLGDPIEAGALLATYGQDREAPLKLGSIKSNIGHTQAAAGVAGVIKSVMAMREGVMPKTLHVDAPSSNVDWEAGKIELLSEGVEWTRNGRPRRAGVSSFGVSGTNAHLILERAPEPQPARPGEGETREQGDGAAQPALAPRPLPLALSAKSEPALRAQAERLAAHMREDPELDPADLAYSLATTRPAFERRAVVVGGSRDELLAVLDALGRGEGARGAVIGRAVPGAKLAYLFTGQGSQRAGMGRELQASNPVFAAAMDAALAELDPHLDRPLRELLFAEPGSPEAELLDHTTYAQPALFALQVALFAALRAQGLAPDFLAGHSVGEISAAHVAGVLSLPDAAKLIAARGRLMGQQPGGGAMVAIEATEAEAAAAIAGHEGELSIAAINSPASVVISGARAPLEQLAARFGEQGRKTKALAVSHAFHSPLMEPMLEDFAEVASGLAYSEPQVPIVSNVSGELLTPEQATDPAYWVAHVRAPVRFAAAVAALDEGGVGAYLELGPDGVLSAMAAQCLAGQEPLPALVPALRAERPEAETLALCPAAAHASGIRLDWEALFAGTGAGRVALPTYPFQRRRFWLSATPAADASAIGQGDPGHPLLGAVVEDPQGEGLTLTGSLSLRAQPWLADHAVAGTPLLPGSVFVELALRAGAELGVEELAELGLEAPLTLPEQGAVALQVRVEAAGGDGSRPVAVYSRAEGDAGDAAGWVRNASGLLAAGAADEGAPVPEPVEGPWPPPGAEPLDTELLHDRLAGLGLDCGPAFGGLRAAWRKGRELFAEVQLAEGSAASADRFGLHPILLDVASQADLLLLGGDGERDELLMPASWGGVRLHAPGASSLRVRVADTEAGRALSAFDAGGAPVASIASIAGRPLEPTALHAARRHRSFFQLRWPQLGSAQVPASRSRVAVLGEARAAAVEAERFPDLAALLASIAAGGAVPDAVVTEVRVEGAVVESGCRAAAEALELAESWLAAEPLAGARLVFVTERAVSVSGKEEEGLDLAAAAAWGAVRSVQAGHRDRFGLLDTDRAEASEAALPVAIAQGQEPELALREGSLQALRLARVETGEEEQQVGGQPFDPERTVLLSGSSGPLIARHLVERHGARRLLLVNCGGEGGRASEAEAELAALGATVSAASCEIADRGQLQALLATIPAAHSLGAVIHGADGDGMPAALAGERRAESLRARLDAALNLHELTAEMELRQFLLFSSAAGILGAAADSGVADAFVEGLAAQRRGRGLPAISLAWGPSALDGDGGDLEGAAPDHLQGVVSITAALGLELLDLALPQGEAPLVAAELDRAALRARARAGTLPAALGDVVGDLGGGAEEPLDPLPVRLARASARQREPLVIEHVRSQIAEVLGHASASEVEPDRALQEMGFDSLGVVELRNRLAASTGLEIAVMALLDNPTPAAIARHLLARLAEPGAGAPGSAAGAAGIEASSSAAESSTAFVSLLGAARRNDQIDDFLQLIADAARFRPAFESLAPGAHRPAPVRLAEGAEAPRLIMLPSAGAMSGPHEYVRLAREFQGRRGVSSLPLPGFGAGEPLPGSMRALVQAQADQVLEEVGGDDFALVGHSSGGWIAQALAVHLEGLGSSPLAVFLIDTFSPEPGALRDVMPALMAAIDDAASNGMGIDDTRLTAMGAYRTIFDQWAPADSTSPTVLIRGTGSSHPTRSDSVGEWGASWKFSGLAFDVPGDHFSMMTEHAVSTASAIEEALAELPIGEKQVSS